MGYKSKTSQFSEDEMGLLGSMFAAELAKAFRISDPIVVLRSMAEIMLNHDELKLTKLLNSRGVTKRWRQYAKDHGVESRDHEYARQLEQLLAASHTN